MNFSHCRFLIAALYFSVTIATQAGTADFAEYRYTNASGVITPYRFLVPKSYQTGVTNRFPLILFFHGAGERGNDNLTQLRYGTDRFASNESRQKFPCFVIAPQCPTNHKWVDMDWTLDSGTRPQQPSEHLQNALAILDKTICDYAVDTNRIYVTGLSMGGFATWDCVTRFPERFAAAAPVCGGGDERTVTPMLAKVPLWTFHSIDDRTVKVQRSRNMIAAMLHTGGRPHYFEYHGVGHRAWELAYAEPDLLAWMFSQSLGKPDVYALTNRPSKIPEAYTFPPDSAFPGKGIIRNYEWFKIRWSDRRTQWIQAEKDTNAVVFFGDSITQGWGSLSKDFPDLKVANRGIGGDFTRGLLYRLQPDVLALNPRAIVLLIGTNDLEEGADPKDIADNLRLLLTRCKAHNPKMPVIVCKILPSHEKKKRPADKIQRVNALVDEIVASDPQWIRCDTWSIFADENGNARKEEFPDLLHPNARGYQKFAAALRPIFDKLVLESQNSTFEK